VREYQRENMERQRERQMEGGGKIKKK